MPSLEEIYARLKTKKQEKKEIQKAFKNSLASNPRYTQITEQLKTLKEEKKSIENQEWANNSADAQRLDELKLDIESDKENLSDVALNLYTEGKSVEIIDEFNNRYTPKFNANFRKDAMGPTEADFKKENE